MHDLVIRGGIVVDGTGALAREADVAVDGALLTAIGKNLSHGRRELDAQGLLVTPGWVDLHTHYDGQVTWDPYLTPSGWHGVTTVVMGNCGVGFAPAKPERHAWLIGLMEGVEDIPGTALAEGIRWEWESFPEYLAALERMPRALDVAAQVPHGAVRAYVMGERGAKNEKATPKDIAAMAEIVREAIAAGAVGFSTSRTLLHRAVDGEPVPGTFAGDEEVLGIGRVLGELGQGVFELASDLAPEARELAWMHRLSRETGRPVTFACLQNDFDPGQWRRLLGEASRSAAEGGRVTPQVAARPTGLLMGLQSTAHPFLLHPAYREIAHLPLAERVRALQDPERRRRLVQEPAPHPNALGGVRGHCVPQALPAWGPAGLRTGTGEKCGSDRQTRGTRAARGGARSLALARGTRAPLLSAAELRQRGLRTDPRDADAPDVRARAVRRRRPLRTHL